MIYKKTSEKIWLIFSCGLYHTWMFIPFLTHDIYSE